MSSEALANIIEGHYAAHLHCHVLIDPLAIAGRSDHALLAQLREALGEAALTRVHRADLAHAPHLHPVLVCLASPGAMPSRTLLELTARTAQRGLHQRRRYLSGWLFSEAAPVTLAAHVSALCRIPNAERAFSFYPVYEPVRLELLAATFERVEQGPWWPVSNWLFLSSGGRLSSLKGQSGQRHPLPRPARRIQDDVPLIEQVLAMWRVLRAGSQDASHCQIPPFAAVRASNHIDDARRLGLSTQEDIVVFALHHLCIHPRLHTVAAVRRMVDAAVGDHRPLAPMLARYSEAQWCHLIDPLPEAERRL
ncbi:hypothetical protein QEM42_002445 [Pseudomonas putida]|uniref:hypothetical protein n=1 Tax=Pseudomonas TaxID=286 RepID=UPI0011982FCD|nr:hypothetical protein [Pseudomonas putida]EKT4561272.1 hypothetical protein [Pseudomonas putida]MDP9541551.1 hypothetical protein [Pseudomonas putida]QDY39076.1 hypothetical protein CHR26_23520 [Pseudomonas putida]